MDSQMSILRKAPAFAFYDELNSKFVPCKYCNYCDSEKKLFDDQPDWVKNLCYKLARNIEMISNIDDTNTELKNKRCKDLVYWVHDTVINTHGIKELGKYMGIIGKLHRPWNEILYSEADKKKLCKTGDLISHFDKETEIKKMDDYCENYDYISSEINKTGANCKPYHNYLNESSTVHAEIIQGCSKQNGKTHCPKIRENCQNLSPHVLLNKTPCKVIKTPHLFATGEDETRDFPQSPCLGLEGSGALPEMSHIRMDPDLRSICEGRTSFDFSDKRAIFLLVFSVWGIFLTLFLFYKSTPFGSWINRFLRKKNLIKEDLGENEFHTFEDEEYNSVDSNVQNDRYGLTYNPA
ncbi:PIR protein [Plasmodium ovale]|uniref:PIR protein n=1 Tax=Plasmodium ovale TaxID=36330 RepID=A0A1C3KIY3_PLAOA|nr:PIR protein [Plasmodium ovale]